MIRNRTTYAVAAALVATLAVAGCKKDEPAAPEATTAPPPPTLEPTTEAAPMAASAEVTGVELGTAVGPDMRVTAPASAFAPADTIHASVSTMTTDPAATVPARLGVKWTFGGDTVVHEETQDVNLSGKGVTAFQISKPDGWPAGSYKLDVMLDGKVVQSRDFEVK
ncbi:hypothetical protein [Marilutibacter spongiae]|uniref:Uncharacterized protein n=1 Tax=Marilutibacter spongiae TaxID=2025720 RepID=A0A7W3TK99_9GAMM|nr:hypothetical protein [Lysobacter spongiae]MBB1059907.1 hypothetical protein [Lysobacter spongiae]